MKPIACLNLNLNLNLILIIATFVIIPCSLFAQQGKNGFTNKNEAKNARVHGLKEGKWVEYYKIERGAYVAVNDKGAPYYRLIVYKAGKPYGLVREYYKDGKLKSEIPYINGREIGVEKQYSEDEKLIMVDSLDGNGNGGGIIKSYYSNGKLKQLIPFTQSKMKSSGYIFYNHEQNSVHGIKDGLVKVYYPTGKPESAITYVEGKKDGKDREYYENGRLKSETLYINNQKVKIINYDENGKKIK